MNFLRNGQTTLSLVFVIGGIVVLVGATLAVIVITLINASFGFQAATRAQAIANGGVEDAILQIMRNKDFEDISGYCVPAETLPCSEARAKVTVDALSPVAGQTTIVSEASVLRYNRKVQAVVSISSSTNAVDVISWELISI